MDHRKRYSELWIKWLASVSDFLIFIIEHHQIIRIEFKSTNSIFIYTLSLKYTYLKGSEAPKEGQKNQNAHFSQKCSLRCPITFPVLKLNFSSIKGQIFKAGSPTR